MPQQTMPHKPRLVIFDMDGLMFDTERVAYAAIKRSLAECGKDISPDSYAVFVGMSHMAFLRTLSEMFPDINAKQVDDRAFEHMKEIYRTQGVPVKQGLYELLDYLDTTGIMRIVATSTSRNLAREMLEIANVQHRFHGMLCGDEIKNSKPAPDIFIAAADKLGIAPQRCVVLEDSRNGVLASHAAKIPVIMVPDMRQPDSEIQPLLHRKLDSLLDVRDYLAALPD